MLLYVGCSNKNLRKLMCKVTVSFNCEAEHQ